MKKEKNMKLFIIGAVSYGLIEKLYRGFTHWTMPLTGGLCFITLCKYYRRISPCSLLKMCLIGSMIISAIEFICGYIVNIILGMRVWDYSRNKFNILGQICPFYSMLWGLLTIPICLIAKREH